MDYQPTAEDWARVTQAGASEDWMRVPKQLACTKCGEPINVSITATDAGNLAWLQSSPLLLSGSHTAHVTPSCEDVLAKRKCAYCGGAHDSMNCKR
jgi:hypothetical protein